MPGFLSALTGAIRRLRRNGRATLVSAGTLAIGVGAAIAVFTVIDTVLLQAPSYAEPNRLVLLWNTTPGETHLSVPAPDVAEVRAWSRTLSGVTYIRGTQEMALEQRGAPEALRVGVASADLFSVLGVVPVVGRLFTPEEVLGGDPDNPPPAPVLLSHQLWRESFGGDPGIVGRSLRLDGRSVTVVGVLPRGFRLLLPVEAGIPASVDAWLPLQLRLDQFRRQERMRDQDSDNRGIVIARLAAGATLGQAQAELDGIAVRQRTLRPDYERAHVGIRAVPLQREATAAARPLLATLLAAVVLLLTLTAANTSGLLLARTADRAGELAVRSALGASRRHLTGLVVGEGMLIAAAAGVAGLLLGSWGAEALLAHGPADLAGAAGPKLDGRVAFFAIAVTVLGALLATALPALRAGDVPATLTVRSARGSGGSRRNLRARRGLVLGEVALSVVLLVGAGLLARTMVNLGRVQPGFQSDGVVTFDLGLVYPDRYRGPADRNAFVRRLDTSLRTIPGVTHVGVIGGLPLAGAEFTQPWGREGEPPSDWSGREANYRVISDDYFATMGTRLLAGRAFTPADDRQDRRVAIVDQALARQLAPDGDAVGLRIGIPVDGEPVSALVIGIAENVRYEKLNTPGRPTVYVPYRHEASRHITVAVKAPGVPTAALAPAIRQRLTTLDPRMPLFDFQSMNEYVRRATAGIRFALAVLLAFALLSAFLAALGLYTLIAYAVGRRTGEFGIRLALGADRRTIAAMVLRDGARVAFAGVAAGLAGALLVTRLLRSLLFHVSTVDPWTYCAVALLALVTTLAATWIPARRAASLDPGRALRQE